MSQCAVGDKSCLTPQSFSAEGSVRLNTYESFRLTLGKEEEGCLSPGFSGVGNGLERSPWLGGGEMRRNDS